MSKKRERIIGGIVVIGIEILLGCIGLFLFFHYYNTLTKNKSIAQAYEHKVSIPRRDVEIKIKKEEGDINYQGVFGIVKKTEKSDGGTIFSSTARSLGITKLNEQKIYMYHLVSDLLQKKAIDNNVATYLLKKDTAKEQEDILNDFAFLEPFFPISLETTSFPTKNVLIPYISLIQKKDYLRLIALLENLERITAVLLTKNENTKQAFITPFLLHENFSYLRAHFIEDKENIYRDNIKKVAEIFDLNPNLIKSAILSEQVRGFFTYRGVAKKILQDNFSIMSMGQGSYGIGGVKLETAEVIENRLAIRYPGAYKTYITNENENPHEIRKKRLESGGSIFHQVFYVGAIIKEIVEKRKESGYEIETKPGIILTLYNIGNTKKPHSNPEIGGAEIDIQGNTYTFGSLGMFLFYYLEMYNL